MPSTEALEPVPDEHPRSAKEIASLELVVDSAMTVNQSEETRPEEPVAAPVVEQPVSVPMSPLGGLHEVGDPGTQPVSIAEVTTRTDADVSGGPSLVELGGAAAHALGAYNVPDSQRNLVGSGALSQPVPRQAPPLVAIVEETEEICHEGTPPPSWFAR